jgi:hypothetical protein
MSVRVSVIFIVQAPIGTHASFGQTADILPNSCYLFGSVQLRLRLTHQSAALICVPPAKLP